MARLMSSIKWSMRARDMSSLITARNSLTCSALGAIV